MGGRGTSSSGSIGGRGHQDFGGDWVAMYNQLDADLKRATKDANKFVGDVYVSSSPKPKKPKKGGK